MLSYRPQSDAHQHLSMSRRRDLLFSNTYFWIGIFSVALIDNYSHLYPHLLKSIISFRVIHFLPFGCAAHATQLALFGGCTRMARNAEQLCSIRDSVSTRHERNCEHLLMWACCPELGSLGRATVSPKF